ncbi:MAG: GrpB family protein [Streptosporangiaceae bacterium]
MEARSVIEVVEYDEAWPVRAAAARADLISLGVFDAVEHIGSTSVPGLAAKPVIDLMAAAASLDAVAGRERDLAGLGYHRFDTGMPDRLFYYRDEDGQRACQLHVVPVVTWPTRNERLLRDHLRDHPDDARRYGELKQRLAAEHTDGTAYTKAKTGLIQELTDRARADRGLPPAPVWEE